MNFKSFGYYESAKTNFKKCGQICLGIFTYFKMVGHEFSICGSTTTLKLIELLIVAYVT